jgi:hypothetical protein
MRKKNDDGSPTETGPSFDSHVRIPFTLVSLREA